MSRICASKRVTRSNIDPADLLGSEKHPANVWYFRAETLGHLDCLSRQCHRLDCSGTQGVLSVHSFSLVFFTEGNWYLK